MKLETHFVALLRSASAQLERALAPIERTFLDAGSGLMEAIGHLGSQTDLFLGLASCLDAEESAHALASLEAISMRIGALGQTAQASRGHLENMNFRAAGLGQRIERLRKVISEIDVLAINAKVEAAHVSARDVDFTVFNREIGRLGMVAGENLDKLSNELSGLLGGMSVAQRDLDRFNNEHRQSLEVVGARLSQGLAAAANRRDYAIQAIRALGDVSSQMAARLALVVEALQVGDITRQRAEHISEALATLLDVLAGSGCSAEERISEDHQRILTGAVCRLQGAQAHHAAQDLCRDLGRIDENINGLIADLDELPARGAEVFGTGLENGSSFLSELGRDFDDVNKLLHGYGAARQRVEEVVANISQVVGGMVQYIEGIRSIEADMRVMGLNATFKCSRLGEQGRTLSIIAQELRGYSNRTAEEGRVIMSELSELVVLAGDMGEDERQGQAAQLEADLAASVKVLERLGAESSASLAALGEAGGRAKAILCRSLQYLRSHPEFVEALAACGASLESVAEEIGEVPSGGLDSIRAEVLDLLRSRYTMASERKVHEMLSGTGSPPETTEENTVDDLLF